MCVLNNFKSKTQQLAVNMKTKDGYELWSDSEPVLGKSDKKVSNWIRNGSITNSNQLKQCDSNDSSKDYNCGNKNKEEEEEDDDDCSFWSSLRRLCCCATEPEHSPLASEIVTHRRISRLTSEDSLDSLETHSVRSSVRSSAPLRTVPTSQQTPVHYQGHPHPYSSTPLQDRQQRHHHRHRHPHHRHQQHHQIQKTGSIKEETYPHHERTLHSFTPETPRKNGTKPHRPTRLILTTGGGIDSANSTPASSVCGSPATTPTLPRGRSGSWATVRAGLTNLVKAATTTHATRHTRHEYDSDDSEMMASFGGGGGTGGSEEGEDSPDESLLRQLPQQGDIADNPATECFGAVSLTHSKANGRWVTVTVMGLSGLPWVGSRGGRLLEISVEPGGRPQWLALPDAHGPNINTQLEATVKAPREHRTRKNPVQYVRVSVWVCGRVWRHAALGHALKPITPTPDPGVPFIAPLLHHTQLCEETLGMLELSLNCCEATEEGEDPPAAAGTQGAKMTLTLNILRARELRRSLPSLFSRTNSSKKKESKSVDVVCRASLWVKGDRRERLSSPSVTLPVTRDPVFRAQCLYTLSRSDLQHAALVIKVAYVAKWGVEACVGRLQLGPLLYLGSTPAAGDDQPPRPCDTPIMLSHWGQALKNPGPLTMWHMLQL